MMEEEALSKVADPLVISVEHHTLYNQIMRAARTRAPRLLVCGPQGSGKSTYARILVNGLLTTVDTRLLQHHVPQVAFLDLDPGQPEFTPPGQVSLLVIQRPVFGPPFSHPFSPDADPQEGFYLISSHATATLTPGADPIQFEACVKSLMLSYLTTLGEEVPLVINYPGWLSAQGVELLLRLTKVICPSTVIYLGELSPTKAVDALRGLSDQITLHVLPSHTGRRHLRTPAQLRAMQTCSYFHLIQSRAGLLQWDATPLTRVPSWVIGYDAGPRAISLSVSGGIRLSLPNVLRVISGSVVAVVVVYKPDIFTSENVTAPDPAQSSCLGQALVRSIDSFTKTMQLVTPIPRALLDGMFDQGYHLVLVCGRGDIPHWAYDEELNVANSRSAKASSSLGAQRTQSMTGTAAAVTQ
ncbi:MAG: Polynucleotide 5'-hydroxyl-kinase grc3 [Thelocarpon superellum]|nr:MAG: Polynucleotide 5'-hydroxyl-kinase grc3 [Thelocarpon superellum]